MASLLLNYLAMCARYSKPLLLLILCWLAACGQNHNYIPHNQTDFVDVGDENANQKFFTGGSKEIDLPDRGGKVQASYTTDGNQDLFNQIQKETNSASDILLAK